MKIILAAITFGLIALTIDLIGYPEETIKVVYLVAVSVIFMTFTLMFYSIFQAYERMEYQSIGRILNAALMLGGVVFAIKYGLGVVDFASLYAIASIVVLGYSFAILRWKFTNPCLTWSHHKMELDWTFWGKTLKEALPFGLTFIA